MAKKRRSPVLIILIILAVIFGGIQFFSIDRSVPSTDPALDLMAVTNPPAHVRNLIHQGCYDCHSYETEYPWYAYVEPVSWFLEGHIHQARNQINFSEWGTYSRETQLKIFKHASHMVQSRKMPLWSFRIEHPEARFTDDDIKTLTAWFNQEIENPGK